MAITMIRHNFLKRSVTVSVSIPEEVIFPTIREVLEDDLNTLVYSSLEKARNLNSEPSIAFWKEWVYILDALKAATLAQTWMKNTKKGVEIQYKDENLSVTFFFASIEEENYFYFLMNSLM